MNPPRATTTFLLLLALAAPLRAQDAATILTHENVMRSASEDLAAAEKNLAELRANIEAGRKPLTDAINARESKLAELRHAYDEKRRALDVSGLDKRKVELEIKARTEENTYLGNLVDEFVRGFETRLHAAELSGYIDKITQAKLAPDNNNLSLKEKFNIRSEIIHLAFNRLINLHKNIKFKSSALEASGAVIEGTAALIGPIAVFHSTAGAAGLLIGQPGSGRPILRVLDPAIGSGIRQLIESNNGLVPYDPTKGAALSAFLKKASLVEKFLHGGPIMWPILACSIVGVAVSLERLLYFFLKRSQRSRKNIAAVFEAVAHRNLQLAIQVGQQSKDYVAQMLSYALAHSETSLQTAITTATAKEMKRWTTRLWMLDTVITMAPLLGLLGTVVGMMGSFEGMAGTDAAAGTNAITSGIAEALIATAFGLCIAIMALIPLNFLNDRIEEAQHELEHSGRELELAVASIGGLPPVQGHHHPEAAAAPQPQPARPALPARLPQPAAS